MVMKIAHNTDIDHRTVQIDDENNIKSEWSLNTGLPLSFGSMEEVIQEARTKGLSIVDFRKQTVEITENINLRGLYIMLPNTSFRLVQKDDGSFPNIELGGDSHIRENPYQEIGSVLRSTWVARDLNPTKLNDYPSVVIVGAKNQHIKLDHVDYLKLEMRKHYTTDSISYSTFDFNFIQKLEIAPIKGQETDKTLWCNENIFNIRRLYGLGIYGAYQHNNNWFSGASFDYQDSYIDIQSGRNNHLYNMRLEEIFNITFGENTELNVIEQAWTSSLGKSFELGVKSPVITDNGQINRIVYMVNKHSFVQRVFSQKGNLSNSKTWSVITTTPKFEIEANKDLLVFDWDNPSARYLVMVHCYDVIGNEIIPDKYNSLFLKPSTAGRTTIEGNYFGGQAYGSRYLVIQDKRVVAAKVSVFSNADLSQQVSTKFTLDLYSDTPRAINI